MAKYRTRSSKRKRSDDDDDFDVGMNDSEDFGNAGGTAGVVRPDAALSSSSTTNQPAEHADQLIIPDDFPTLLQLETILSYVQSVCPENDVDYDRNNTHNTNLTLRRDTTVEALKKIVDWADYDIDNDDETRHKTYRFCTMFLQLGGLLRMTLFIELTMKDIDLVHLAVEVLSVITYYRFRFNDGDKLKELIELSCIGFFENGCFRTLILAIEEFSPSGTEKHGRIVARLWAVIRNILYDRKDEIPLPKLNDIVETGLQCFDDILKSSPETKMHVFKHTALALSFVLSEDMAPFYKERRVVCKCLKVCQTYATEWFGDEFAIIYVFDLVRKCTSYDVSSDDDLLEWAPLIGRSISENLTNDGIQINGARIISKMVKKIDHRKLERTSLPSSLQAIIQSSDASEELKAKYRSILSKIYQ